MTKKVKHTPTPWEIEKGTNGFTKTWKVCYKDAERHTTIADCGAIVNEVYINDTNHFSHLQINDEHIANAQFIVKVVNSHDELVKLVKNYLSLLESDYVGSNNKDLSNGQIELVKKALKKAGE